MDIPSDRTACSPVPPKPPETVALPHNSSTGKQLMSATLRERLKKTRSSFNSSHAVAKRLKEDTENNSTTSKEETSSPGGNCSAFSENCESIKKASEESLSLKDNPLVVSTLSQMDPEAYNVGKQELLEEKMKLLKQVQEKEELLRRLKLTKMYRSKNNLSQLQSLIKKWRNSSQLLLFELQSTLSVENKKLSLTQLIDCYGLEDQLLHYNRIEEDFTDF